MLDFHPVFFTGVAGLIAAGYSILLWFRSQTYKLKHIPTIGSSGIIGSSFDAFKFAHYGREMVQEGYTKYYGTPFKIPAIGRYNVVISGSQMFEDIRNARDDQLSFREAISEIFQTDYMMGTQIRLDSFHIPVLRTTLTRNLGVRFPDIRDEITVAFSELIPVRDTKEWIRVSVNRVARQIVCRTSNRLFVGLPLCRDPDFCKINEEFTLDVIKGSRTINKFPPLFRPIVGQFFTEVPRSIERILHHVGPIIQERLKKEKQSDSNWLNKPNDLITWLLAAAQGPQRTVRNIALRILSTNFASIHTTSTVFTHIIYDLAAHSEYVTALREEIEAIVEVEGWTKASQGKMRKLDSFIKESQRMAIGALSMNRKVLKDFTFSNGVTIPAGSHLAFATNSTHFDEINYTNPDTFDGFRFADMRDEEGEGTKHQMVALASDYVTFGTGRHACPGRFFAVNELKAMLAHVLLTYDVKLVTEGRRPENVWSGATCVPDPTAEVLFRKRL